MRLHLAAFLLLTPVLVNSCNDCEEPIPHETLSAIDYIPMTAGSWWAYANMRYRLGEEPEMLYRDTLWALGDTVINGEDCMRFYGRLDGYSSPDYFALRDSAFNIVRHSGQLVLPYHNFTDTFRYTVDSLSGWYAFSILVQDTTPTIVPAGAFESIDFRTEIGRGSFAGQVCPDRPVGYHHFKFSEGVGMLLSTHWYSSTGPCTYFARELQAYHIE